LNKATNPQYFIWLTVFTICFLFSPFLNRSACSQDQKELQPLIDLFKGAEGEVRRQAAEALGGVGPDAQAGVPNLSELFKGAEGEVRRQAAEALGGVGPDRPGSP